MKVTYAPFFILLFSMSALFGNRLDVEEAQKGLNKRSYQEQEQTSLQAIEASQHAVKKARIRSETWPATLYYKSPWSENK